MMVVVVVKDIDDVGVGGTKGKGPKRLDQAWHERVHYFVISSVVRFICPNTDLPHLSCIYAY